MEFITFLGDYGLTMEEIISRLITGPQLGRHQKPNWGLLNCQRVFMDELLADVTLLW